MIGGTACLTAGDRRQRLALGLLGAVLVYTSWNFKVMSSLPRILDTGQWWMPLILPETLLLGAALLLSRNGPPGGALPAPGLFVGSVVLYWLGAVLGTVLNPVHFAYLVRVAILQYAVPLMLFVVLWRVATRPGDLRALTFALVAGGLTLFVAATPVYLVSAAAFPPVRPLWWPAERVLFARGRIGQVFNDPRMLYDNVTFGNVLNISQLLVVLLPLALGWLYTARTERQRAVAAVATGLFLLHLFFCYGRGAIVVALVTLAVSLVWFWRARHPDRRVLAGLAAGFVLVTFVAPKVPAYWLGQLTLAEDTTARERAGFILRPLHPWDMLTEVDRQKYRPGRELAGEGLRAAYRRMLTVGLGPGNYGVMVGRMPEAGTHNLFLNALVSTGPLGLAGLVGLVTWGVRNFRRFWWDSPGADPVDEAAMGLGRFWALAFASVLAIGVLSLYELEYLGTSTGALLLWFLLAVSAKARTLPDRMRAARPVRALARPHPGGGR